LEGEAVADAALTVELDRERWQPGERLSGRLRLDAAWGAAAAVRLELSWRAGDEPEPSDSGEGHSEVHTAEAGPLFDAGERRFALPLPAAPLSYEGALVRIRWRLVAQAERADGQIAEIETPFLLGQVEPAAAPPAGPAAGEG
jgi:hypothetical protein